MNREQELKALRRARHSEVASIATWSSIILTMFYVFIKVIGR